MATHHTWKLQLHTNQKQISHHNQESTPTATTLQNGNKSASIIRKSCNYRNNCNYRNKYNYGKSIVTLFLIYIYLHPAHIEEACAYALFCYTNKKSRRELIQESSPLLVLFLCHIFLYKYYVIFIDHFTKYVWFFPLRNKSDVKIIFPQFHKMILNRFNANIKSLYSDNGGEFFTLQPFLTLHSISHYTTSPHTPQQNGVSERRHRHIVETGTTLLSPPTFLPISGPMLLL